jgi:hypothetical protein
MLCIALIRKDGGCHHALGMTMIEVREAAKQIGSAFVDELVATTIPFEVFHRRDTGEYDTMIPRELKNGLGMELRLLLHKELFKDGEMR